MNIPITSRNNYSTQSEKNMHKVLLRVDSQVHKYKIKTFPLTVSKLLLYHDGCLCEADDLLHYEGCLCESRISLTPWRSNYSVTSLV